jgi:hypothetical protein
LETINELELRDLLNGDLSQKEIIGKFMRRIVDPSLSWEEKRPYWNILYNTGRFSLLIEGMVRNLENKQRIPFDLLIDLSARFNLKPPPSVVASVFKAFKKTKSQNDVFPAKGWDKWDSGFTQLRGELVERKVKEVKKHKEQMVEKFHFLQNHRMLDQAGKMLRRMIEIYPEDAEIQGFKTEFDEAWARNVLSNHIATLQAESEKLERTYTAPSSADQQMLKCFLIEAEKIAIENRDAASDFAIAFLFMEDYNRCLEILAWAKAGLATDWLRVEMLFAARRHLEALEQLDQLELKGIDDPETTFAVSYLRAQCLHGLGQRASALEIMQSIVRVRSKYRSAHAFILKWTEGADWE